MTSRRLLGRSGLAVSRIGLGLAALGRPGYINPGRDRDLGSERSPDVLRAHSHGVLDAAWKRGISYFDAARSYGRAEEFLATWLTERQISPEAATVGSKWGYRYTAEWAVRAEVHEVKDLSVEMLRRQWPQTRRRLGEHLDLYQIHSATLESRVLEDVSVLAELVALRHRTGVRIGLSTSGPNQAETIRRAMEVEHAGLPVFDTVQATWNLLEPSAGPALREAKESGMGVIVKEALANGRLVGRSNGDVGLARAIDREAKRLATTPDALALAAALDQPWADVVLSGAATAQQVEANAGALAVVWDEAAEQAVTRWRESPPEYWARRSGLDWN